MDRMYSLLTVKAVEEDGDARVIRGIATTPSTDRMDDVVESEGAEFKLPLPLLWQHRHDQPIGHVIEAKVTSKGIEIVAELARIDEDGVLKNRLDEAWQSIRSGLVRGLSIGFKAIESARMENTGGVRFIKWLWLELSAVTVPANGDATIQTIKSIDDALLAAKEADQDEEVDEEIPHDEAPAATGKTVRIVKLDAPARDRAKKPFVIRKINR